MATEPIPSPPLPALQATPPQANGACWPEVLTLDEAAAFLRLRVATVERLALEKVIPARKVEASWLFLRRGLEEWLLGQDERKDSRTRLLELVGSMKDDETLPQLRAAIYKARGRPEVEEETPE
jgi:excisionase family DNA binding protein